MVSAFSALGLVPSDAVKGDKICQFKGSEYSHIIREVEWGQYVLVGQVCKSSIIDHVKHLLKSLDFLCRVNANALEKYASVGMINLV